MRTLHKIKKGNYLVGRFKFLYSSIFDLQMAEDMAKTAENLLRKAVKAEISIKPRKFNQNEAFGNGSGINLVAVTTTGCFLGGSCLGECRSFRHIIISVPSAQFSNVRNTPRTCLICVRVAGERGVASEEVGRKAAEELLDCITRKDCVDQYVQDQLIIFMALAEGKTRVKTGPITSHTEKAIAVTEMFTDEKIFTITKLDNDCNIIECTGRRTR